MKVAIITGGSRGLGKGVVDILKRRGWYVLELSRTGTGENHHSADMNDSELFIEKAKLLFSSIEECEEIALISNAGTLTPIKRVGEMTSADMVSSFNVNIVSALTMIQAFVEQFRHFSGKKSVVSISSGAATKGYPGWSLYCAGKAACENYLRTLAEEEALEKRPFQVISFNPGVMDTAMQREIRFADPEQFPMLRRFIELKKDGALRDPEQVAEKLVSVIETEYRSENFIYTIYE